MDNLSGMMVVNVNDNDVKFTSNMNDEEDWAVLMMALVSQSYKLGLDKVSVNELLDITWEQAEEQKRIWEEISNG